MDRREGPAVCSPPVGDGTRLRPCIHRLAPMAVQIVSLRKKTISPFFPLALLPYKTLINSNSCANSPYRKGPQRPHLTRDPASVMSTVNRRDADSFHSRKRRLCSKSPQGINLSSRRRSLRSAWTSTGCVPGRGPIKTPVIVNVSRRRVRPLKGRKRRCATR